MKIYDISQEILSSEVYEGDPKPSLQPLSRIAEGACYNLSLLSTCLHSGTHVDAPYHFINDGATVDKIPPEQLTGYAYLYRHEGDFSAEDAARVLKTAKKSGLGAEKRILIGGRAVVSLEAARVLSEAGVLLVGAESQSVGDEKSPMPVHLQLLGSGAVLLEGVRLGGIADGVYFLVCAPIKIAGADGAPARALLIEGI
jgi:arylformamidase